MGIYTHCKDSVLPQCHITLMAQTFHDHLSRVLASLIDKTIDEEKDIIAAGMISDMADYKMHVGIIQGLTKCIDLIDEAHLIVTGVERSK